VLLASPAMAYSPSAIGLRAFTARTGSVSLCAAYGQRQQRQPTPLALPPAASRELAAEVMAATSLLTRSSAKLASQQECETRSLILLSIRCEPSFQQLAGEVISHISSGPRAGTSWLRPLALRTVSNVSLAMAAERFDPTIGWLGTRDADADGPVPSHLHLFSPLAPAIFVPTANAEEIPPATAIAIRSLSQAHAAAAEEAHVDLLRQSDAAAAHGPERADAHALRAFMARLSLTEPGAARTDLDGGGSSSYDPLSRF